MPAITPSSLFESEAVLVILKGAILILLLFYAIFALMVVRQVDLMSKTLITSISPVVKVFALLHAFFAIGLILLAWVIL